jgi:sugar/nucleoside kinase (ribokinase family)
MSAKAVKAKVVLMGHVAIDTIIEQGGKEPRVELGGPAAYCSTALNSLGVSFDVYTRIGRDFPKEYGEFLSRFAGMDLAGSVSPSKLTTRFRIDRTSEPRQMWLEARCETFGKETEEQLEKEPDSSILLANPIAGEIPSQILKSASAHFDQVIADAQGFVRAFDPITGKVSMRPQIDLSLLDRVDYLKADEAEINAMSGQQDLEKSIEKVGRRCEKIILTSGSGPVEFYENSILRFRAMPFRTPVIDTTGAGDIMLAAFAGALAEEKDDRESLRFAVAASTLAVGTKGIRKAILEKRSVVEAAQRVELS